MSNLRVCIIGSGIAGVLTAYFLDKFGADKITVFDKEVIASGATGRSAGLVVTHLFDEIDIELSKRTQKILNEINEKNKFKFLKKYETISASRDEKLIDTLQEKLKKKFIGFEILSLKEIKNKYDFFNEEKKYLRTDDGIYVDTGELLYSVYSYLRKKGHDFKFFYKIENLNIKNERVESITTSRGKFYFDIYVISAGVWSKKILKKIGIELKVKPYRTQAGILILKKDVDFPIFNDLDYNIYMRKEIKNEILVGDGTEGKEANISNYNPSNDDEFIFEIAQKVSKISKEFEDSEYKGGWAGLCLATPDKKPIIGKIENFENLYIICGFNGLGIMRAPALSEILAECIIDNLPVPKEFRNERLKNIKDFEIKEGFYPE